MMVLGAGCVKPAKGNPAPKTQNPAPPNEGSIDS